MPKFEAHMTVSTIGSAVLVALGTARYGWDGSIPALAFVAGAAGGMVPDLDCQTSKPRRLAGFFVGLSAAVGLAGFLGADGPFLNRPWGFGVIILTAALAMGAIYLAVDRLLSRHTRHRGLFHSLAVPFLYGGLMACLAAPRGLDTSMAVWLLSLYGVGSHLVLDAARSLSLHPLKLATSNLTASTALWLATTFVTLAAFIRLTRI